MKLRRIAKITGGILLVMIIALLVVPLFISPDFLKAQLVAQVKKTTGRSLEIKGKTSLRLFPTIAISAEDVTLGNPSGFTGAYFVHIDKLETGAALGPLLSRQLHVTGIELDGASINLEQNANGAKNWEFTAQKMTDTAADAAEKSAATSSPLAGFALGDVHVSKSAFTYNAPGAKPMAASDITLTLSGADGASPLTLEGSARYQGEMVKAHLGVENINAFLNTKATKVTARLEMPGGDLQFDGTGSMKDDITADGKLDASISSLPTLLTWANGIPPAGNLPKSVDLQTEITVRGAKSIALDDLAVNIDGMKAEGKLAVNLAGTVPSLHGALHIGELNMEQWKVAEAASAKTANADPAPAASSGWSETRIDLSGLRAVNAELDLTLDAIRSGALEIGKTAAHVGLNNGVLKLTLGNAVLYGGNAKGTVNVDGSGAAAGIAVNLTVNGVQIEPLVTAFSGASRMQGTANLDLNVRGNGASERAMIGSLGGNGAIKVTDGALKGVNIGEFLRNAKQGFLFGSTSGKSTDFSDLTATFTIAQGILTNKDLAMKSPALRVAGSGTVNLPARSLNYKLIPTIAATSKGQGGKADVGGLAIPLIITGPWSNPQVVPDIAGLVQSGLKNPEALKQNIKDIKSQIKNFNSPKDLGKALFGGGKQDAVPATTP